MRRNRLTRSESPSKRAYPMHRQVPDGVPELEGPKADEYLKLEPAVNTPAVMVTPDKLNINAYVPTSPVPKAAVAV